MIVLSIEIFTFLSNALENIGVPNLIAFFTVFVFFIIVPLTILSLLFSRIFSKKKAETKIFMPKSSKNISRTYVRHFPRIVDKFNISVHIDSSKKQIKTKTKNVSISGLCFNLKEPIVKNTNILISMKHPEKTKSEKFSVYGSIVRVNELAKNKYEYGVAFTGLNGFQRDVLQKIVSRNS